MKDASVTGSNVKKLRVVDRRVQKTRKLLIESLISLTLEKGYDRVTIQDIIERANVGRSTFYSHFESKDQLLTGNDNFHDLLTKSVQAGSNELNFLPIYRHVADYHQVARIFLGKQGGDVVTTHFHNIFVHIIKKYYKGRIDEGKIEKRMFSFLVESSASAMCSLLFSWATNDMPFPPEEIARQSQEITRAFFKRYL